MHCGKSLGKPIISVVILYISNSIIMIIAITVHGKADAAAPVAAAAAAAAAAAMMMMVMMLRMLLMLLSESLH